MGKFGLIVCSYLWFIIEVMQHGIVNFALSLGILCIIIGLALIRKIRKKKV